MHNHRILVIQHGYKQIAWGCSGAVGAHHDETPDAQRDAGEAYEGKVPGPGPCLSLWPQLTPAGSGKLTEDIAREWQRLTAQRSANTE